jgi:hypothetical protein
VNSEQILENTDYDSMPIDDLIYEGLKYISAFEDELSTMPVDNFCLSTPRCDYHFQKLDVFCENLKQINTTMERNIKNNVKLDKNNATIYLSEWIYIIDEVNTPLLLANLRILLKKGEEDIYDRANIRKFCQAYDRLVGEFRSHLIQLKLIAKNKDINSINPSQLNGVFKAIGKERLFQRYLKDP